LKIIKFLSVIFVILLLVCSFAGCKEESGYPLTVGGAEITEAPQTVAVLSEQAASAICALGYKSYLVGAPTEFFKSEMAGVTDLGKAMFIDFEKVYTLAPNVLIVEGELESSVKSNLLARNINVVLLKTPTKYEEIASYYEALSKIFLGSIKYTEAYDAYVGETERIISETATSLKGVTKKVALFVEDGFVATGDTIAGTAMKKAGFTNIAENRTSYMMSYVDIKNADPEIIFCPAGCTDVIMKNESYKDFTAVKNAAVYEVDVEALIYGSEGFAATLQSMAKYILQ
jgi:ABC-type Fe3+-hydroxamate transport system substrate-binding protein